MTASGIFDTILIVQRKWTNSCLLWDKEGIFTPVPSPFPIKHLVFTLSFSQGQVLVLTVYLTFLSRFLSNFPLILFSFYLSFTDGQTTCHNATAGNCYSLYRNIIIIIIIQNTCLLLSLFWAVLHACCRSIVLTTFPKEIVMKLSLTHELYPYFSFSFHPNKV